jgi:transposase
MPETDMKALSLDLRWRIFNHSLNHSIRETARVFKASPNTVYLLAKRFAATGGMAPRKAKAVHARAVSPEGEMFLQILLREDVDMTLAELCGRYERAYGARVGLSTMHNTLKRMGLTYKKRPFMTRPATAPRPRTKKKPTSSS